jgi:hypothetical protein
MPFSALRLTLGILATSVAFAQLGSPQYPNGRVGYPGGRTPGQTGAGIPLPGKKKTGSKKIDENKVIVEGVRGILRKLDTNSIVVQADDKRILQVRREDETRFLKAGKDEKLTEFPLGDHVWIEAYRDEDGFFHALRVNWDKAGTDADRLAAKGPLPESVRFEDDRPAEEVAKEKAKEERGDGPPKLTRGGPKAQKAEEKPAEPAPAAKAPPVEVASAEAPRENATLVVDKAVDDLDGAPRIKRGRPAPRPRNSGDDDIPAANGPAVVPAAPGVEVASAAVGAPRETPPAAVEKLDPLIEKAREIALEFSESLPNYLAKQVTTRFAGEGKKDRWQAQDNFTADVVYQDGKESYRNVMLNGKPAKGKIEQTGSWSRGEFGTTLRDVLSPASNAAFKLRGNSTISNRRAKLYDFQVDQENSHWQIGVPGQTYFPAYRGSIWIDIETARVMRIEMQGRKIPEGFPVDAVESAVEWDFVKIGTGSYLVPVHAESLSCMRSMSMCSKNVMDFRNYRKFGAESELILNQE